MNTIEKLVKKVSGTADVRHIGSASGERPPAHWGESPGTPRNAPRRAAAQRPPQAPVAPPPAEEPLARVCRIDPDVLARRGLIGPDDDRNQLAEEFRLVKRPILKNAFGEEGAARPDANLVMVTSALPSEGKTFCAINLAISVCREVDRTVLLVDADVAKPSVLSYLGLQAEIGLMDVLQDRGPRLSDAILRTSIPNLRILPAGRHHPRSTELLSSPAMDRLRDELAERYADRLVIFDSPPLLATSEASVLAEHMGQVMLVLDSGRTPQSAARQALHRLARCEIVLPLLNRAPRMMSGSGYGYGGGYGGYGGRAGDG